MQQSIGTNLTSFRDETPTERQMRLQILGLSHHQRNVLKNTLNELNDPILFCDEHNEIYLFHNDSKFYCKKCITPQTTGLRLINLDQNDISQQNILNHFLALDDQRNNIIIDNQILEQKIQQQEQQLQNQQQNIIIRDPLSENPDLINRVIENRKRFIKIQEFLSHIPLDIKNRPHHNELHINDDIDLNEELIFYNRIQDAIIRYDVDQIKQKLLSGFPEQQQQQQQQQ